MSHPILALQATLLGGLRADSELVALARVFDAPPKGSAPPYVTIARHDLLPRDGDFTPGNDHRLIFHGWVADASRKAVVTIAERVVAVALAADLDGELKVTMRRHDRTDTAIDAATGRARAAIAMTFYTEPNS
jgi:hypothetical protein